MATTISTHTQWATQTEDQISAKTIFSKWLTIIDSQADSKTLWFMISLIAQGVLFLPIPAVLTFYYHAPVMVLAITLPLFFANIVMGMSGAGIRTIMGLFITSIIIHLIMLAVYIL
jgi:hypothetical protein